LYDLYGTYLTKAVITPSSSPIQGKYEIVKLLLKHGADASKKNRDGHTPLDLVKEGDQVRGVCQNSYAPIAEDNVKYHRSDSDVFAFLQGP
jgi:ankyrin repeat protein